jgi:hypothetical protein
MYYFYEDFFKFVEADSPTWIDRAGVAVPVEGSTYLWTILSPWRIPLAVLAVFLLALSAVKLWKGSPRARVLSLFTLWGVLAPQVIWYTEFLIDWHGSAGLSTALLAAMTIVTIPTLLLYDGVDTLDDWTPLESGRARLLTYAVSLGWIGYIATNVLDHSYQSESALGYGGALVAVVLSGIAVLGLFRLKAWALWAGVAAAVALAMVPFAISANSGTYLPSGGYIDAIVASTSTCGVRTVAYAAIPVALSVFIVGPYLRAFMRKALGR